MTLRGTYLVPLLFSAASCGKVSVTPTDGSSRDAARDAPSPDASVDAPPDAPTALATSCVEVHTRNPNAASGVYMIDADGMAGSMAAFAVYCDMSMDNGGWMLAMSLTIDATGLTWTNLVPSFGQPTSPLTSSTNVLDYHVLAPAGVHQMMLMGGDRILKFYYPRAGVDFTNNYRDLTERAAFRLESVPADAPHTGGSRDANGACGHVSDACTTTDFALFKAADASCPRDATNSHSVTNCNGNCGSFGNCPGNGQTPPSPTPNCWFFGGTNATLVPSISTCPTTSQAPWGNYAGGTLTGLYTLWLR